MSGLVSRYRLEGPAQAAIAGVAAILLFWGLTDKYLWQDEAATAVLATRLLKFGRPLAYDGVNLITVDIPYKEAMIRAADPKAAVDYYARSGQFRPDTTWTWHPWGPFAVAAVSFKALGQSTSLRIGASWTWEGTTPDPSYMTMHPNINVVSRSNAPKKIVHLIWVRESRNIHKPGKIYGKVDLVNELAVENRTTGGDPLNLVGPTIKCKNLETETKKVMRCPIWIQTSDNKWYRAQSTGNPPSFAERLRDRLGR